MYIQPTSAYVKANFHNHRIHLSDKTIEPRRAKYEIAVNPVKAFLETAKAENTKESDAIPIDMLFKSIRILLQKI